MPINEQELSGRLFAHELILNVLLKAFVDRQIPGNAQNTEHLETFVRDLQTCFEAQATRMTSLAASEAKKAVERLLDASLQKYRT